MLSRALLVQQGGWGFASAAAAAWSLQAPRHTKTLLTSYPQHVRKASSVPFIPKIEADKDALALSVDADGFATILLNRGDTFNTFSDKVIARYVEVLTEIEGMSDIRGVFVKSTGKFFCAGGNLKWMKNSVNLTNEENIADALHLSHMLQQFNTLPHPTIGLVQGPAFGGGVGIISCCDMAVAVKRATFTLSEVKLGLIPATISPFVVAKIGAHQSRRFMLTAEAIDSETAHRIGLVNEVVDDESGLDAWCEKLKDSLMLVGPQSAANTKLLIESVANKPIDHDVMQHTAERLAEQRCSEEGRTGLAAFFAREPAPWNKKRGD